MNPKLTQLKNRLESSLIDIWHTPIADASVLIAITNEPKPLVMLTRRASHLKSHAGEVSFPGGKYEADDESNISTAIRETHEETNLSPEVVEVIGQLPIHTSKAGLSVRPIVAIIPPDQSYRAEPSEIARIFWVALDWLIVTDTVEYSVTFKSFCGNDIGCLKTPSWSVDGEIVWGLTGKIIASMLKVGFDREIEWYYKSIT